MKTVYTPVTQEIWDEFKKLAIDRKLTVAGLVAEVVTKEVEQSRKTVPEGSAAGYTGIRSAP